MAVPDIPLAVVVLVMVAVVQELVAVILELVVMVLEPVMVSINGSGLGQVTSLVSSGQTSLIFCKRYHWRLWER